MKTNPNFNEKFKKRAVAMLCNSEKPAVQIARELGCTADTLRTGNQKYDNCRPWNCTSGGGTGGAKADVAVCAITAQQGTRIG